MKTTLWPPRINKKVEIVINAIKHILDEDEEVAEKHLREELARVLFSKYIQDGDIDLSESEFETVYTRAVVKTEFDQLIQRGILGCIEDERGEEVVYFTKLGKKSSY